MLRSFEPGDIVNGSVVRRSTISPGFYPSARRGETCTTVTEALIVAAQRADAVNSAMVGHAVLRASRKIVRYPPRRRVAPGKAAR